jgi:mono/diheme cytochrome c family protein
VNGLARLGRLSAATAAAIAITAPLVLAANSGWPGTTTVNSMFNSGHLESTSGEIIYLTVCQGCHMPDGHGASGAGHYPALAGDRALISAQFMAITIIEGRRNMPPFGGLRYEGYNLVPALDDEQVAAVTNYVRTHFGNHFKGTITPAQVKALRRLPANSEPAR